MHYHINYIYVVSTAVDLWNCYGLLLWTLIGCRQNKWPPLSIKNAATGMGARRFAFPCKCTCVCVSYTHKPEHIQAQRKIQSFSQPSFTSKHALYRLKGFARDTYLYTCVCVCERCHFVCTATSLS